MKFYRPVPYSSERLIEGEMSSRASAFEALMDERRSPAALDLCGGLEWGDQTPNPCCC